MTRPTGKIARITGSKGTISDMAIYVLLDGDGICTFFYKYLAIASNIWRYHGIIYHTEIEKSEFREPS